MQISAALEKIWVSGGRRDQDPLCCVFKHNVTLRELLSPLANQGLQAELPVRSNAGHFREPGCRFGFVEKLVPVLSCAAAAGCCEGAMGDPGSHDMVREGLLSPDGKSEWEVREPVWRVLPGTGTG